MAETLKVGNLTIHFLGDNAATLKSTINRVYGSAAARTGSQAFRSEISETARYFKNIYVGGSLQDLEQVPGYKDARIDPAALGTPKAAFGKPLAADTYVMVVPGREHTLVHGGRTFPGSTELAMAHELLHPMQLIREWARTGILFQSDAGSETQVQMREQRIAIELGMVVGRDFPDVIGTETGYEVHLKPPASQPARPADGKIDPTRPQPGLPPPDGDINHEPPANDGRAKRSALGQDRFAETAYGTIKDRLAAYTAVGSDIDRTPIKSNFSTGKISKPQWHAASDRTNELKALLGDRHSEYWQGPKAEALQQEYRDLVEADEQGKALRRSVSLSPDAARTLIGSTMTADRQPAGDESASMDRAAELQALMADQHSEYWRGPEADALQQEYRDLIESRDGRKKREENASLFDVVS